MGRIAGEDTVSFYSEKGILLGHVMRHVRRLEIMHLLRKIALSSPSGAAAIKNCFPLSSQHREADVSMLQTEYNSFVLQLIGSHIYAEGHLDT